MKRPAFGTELPMQIWLRRPHMPTAQCIGLAMLFAVASAPFASAAAQPEEDKRAPMVRYRSDTYLALTMCKLKRDEAIDQAFLIASQGRAPGEVDIDWWQCVVDARKEALPMFQAALKTVRKPAAKEALKSCHVAYIAALEGLRPGPSERKVDYSIRQQALTGRLTETWARFDIEQ